jgi:hypothetical protein
MNSQMRSYKLSFMFAGVLASAPPSLMAADESVKMAAIARFDLSADRPGVALVDGHVALGRGTIRRMSWLPESARSRGYTVNFPVSFTRWRSLAVQFTPDRTGTITLTLLGPWEEVSKGVPYRQEVNLANGLEVPPGQDWGAHYTPGDLRLMRNRDKVTNWWPGTRSFGNQDSDLRDSSA